MRLRSRSLKLPALKIPPLSRHLARNMRKRFPRLRRLTQLPKRHLRHLKHSTSPISQTFSRLMKLTQTQSKTLQQIMRQRLQKSKQIMKKNLRALTSLSRLYRKPTLIMLGESQYSRHKSRLFSQSTSIPLATGATLAQTKTFTANRDSFFELAPNVTLLN